MELIREASEIELDFEGKYVRIWHPNTCAEMDDGYDTRGGFPAQYQSATTAVEGSASTSMARTALGSIALGTVTSIPKTRCGCSLTSRNCSPEGPVCRTCE